MPERTAKEMPRGLVPGVGVGKHDVAHFIVALEHPDRALKESLCERASANIPPRSPLILAGSASNDDSLRVATAENASSLAQFSLSASYCPGRSFTLRKITRKLSRSALPLVVKGLRSHER
ncbi:hypothetical protein [Rhizobium leguminosarum]|uniref:hypothetical protein n=1 Tax=Rhizobium leguminosarum TaxID=384 RepID=UPI003D6E91FA